MCRRSGCSRRAWLVPVLQCLLSKDLWARVGGLFRVCGRLSSLAHMLPMLHRRRSSGAGLIAPGAAAPAAPAVEEVDLVSSDAE